MKNSKLMFKVFATLATIAFFSLTGCSDSGSNASDEGGSVLSNDYSILVDKQKIVVDEQKQIISFYDDRGACTQNDENVLQWTEELEYDSDQHYFIRNDTLYIYYRDEWDEEEDDIFARIFTGNSSLYGTWNFTGCAAYLNSQTLTGKRKTCGGMTGKLVVSEKEIKTYTNYVQAYGHFVYKGEICNMIGSLNDNIGNACVKYFRNVKLKDNIYKLYDDETGRYSSIPSNIQITDDISISKASETSAEVKIGSKTVRVTYEIEDLGWEAGHIQASISVDGTTCKMEKTVIDANDENCKIENANGMEMEVSGYGDVPEIEAFFSNNRDEFEECVAQLRPILQLTRDSYED